VRAAPSTVVALILDLLEWIGPQTRPYREVMEAWRTSCPRLPVWEEAQERGFIGQVASGRYSNAIKRAAMVAGEWRSGWQARRCCVK